MAFGGQAGIAPHHRGYFRQVGGNARDFLSLLFRSPRPARIRSAWIAPARLIVGAAFALAAIAAIVLLLDVPASNAVRRLPPGVISAFDTISDLGKSGWLLFPLGSILLALGFFVPKIRHGFDRLVLISLAVRLAFIFAAIALPGIFVTVLKRLIGRARPFVEPDGGSFFLLPFGWQADYASIPSGHGTTAFAAAVAIGAMWPRTRAFMWLYALLVAASRVVVTAHYPSDLVASAFVGVLGALLVRHTFAVRRLAFVVDQTGRVQALAGPSFRRLRSVARKLFAY